MIQVINSILSKELKNGIEILVGQAVFMIWIKTVKCCFDQYLTQDDPLGLLEF